MDQMMENLHIERRQTENNHNVPGPKTFLILYFFFTMHTIKFRWKTKKGKRVYGSLMGEQKKTYIHDRKTETKTEVEEDSIWQFIWLLDKEEQEIYFGDILREEFGNCWCYTLYEVRRDETRARFEINTLTSEDSFDIIDVDEMKIVWNTTDNRDLR